MVSFLSGVRGTVAQRVHPVARKHSGVLLRAGFGRGDHDAPRFCSAPTEPPLALVVLYDQLPLGRDAVAQNSEVFSGNVRPGQIEFIYLLAVVGAMPNQHQRKFIFRFGLTRNFARAFPSGAPSSASLPVNV